jgi:hypothetical protein
MAFWPNSWPPFSIVVRSANNDHNAKWFLLVRKFTRMLSLRFKTDAR